MIDALPFCQAPKASNGRPCPTADNGGQSLRNGGCDRHNEISQATRAIKGQGGARRLDASQAALLNRWVSAQESTAALVSGDGRFGGNYETASDGGSASSESATLGGGGAGQLLRPGLQISPVQRPSKAHEHRNDEDGNEQRFGWHAYDLL